MGITTGIMTIILARKGDFDQAEEILGKAKENGLDSVNVKYVEGEILLASSRYEEAKAQFSDCISQTQDNDLKMRAYLMTAKSMEIWTAVLVEKKRLRPFWNRPEVPFRKNIISGYWKSWQRSIVNLEICRMIPVIMRRQLQYLNR